MKKLNYFLPIFLFLLIGCKEVNNGIQQQDVDFISSLKKPNKKNHLTSIDSVLNLQNQSEARIALLYLKKGEILSIIQDDAKAVKNLEIALDLFKKIDSEKYIGKTYWHLGSANAFLLNKVLANEQLHTALQYSKALNDKNLEADIYGSLAQIYYLYNDFETSINYTLMSIKIYKTLNDTHGLSASYNNIALELSILKNDTNAIAKSYNNIGKIEDFFNDKEKAIKHFLLAISMNKKLELLNSSPLTNLGNLYLESKNFEGAKYNYLQALKIENKKENLNSKVKLNNKLLQISLYEKDFKKALFFQKERDSLINRKNQKDTQEKLDLVENQYKLIVKEKDLEQAKNSIKKNKIIFITLLGFLVLLAIFMLQFIRSRKLRNNNERIYLELKVLRSQMNPHFIFNALSAIQNSILDNDQITASNYLSRFAKLIRQNFDFINHKTIPLRDELDALNNYVETQQMRFQNKFEYAVNVSENIDINLVEIPPLLLQPFIENSIEHGFKAKKDKGFIQINISSEKNMVCFEIIDNGNGLTPSKNKKRTHSTDIFMKRLKLIGNKDEETFTKNASDKGTTIKFSLKK